VLLLLSGCSLRTGPPGPLLEFESLVREEVEGLVAGSTEVRWTASATGGSGQLRYEFRTSMGSVEIVEQEGPSPIWNPGRSGTFRVKATVEDGTGARVESGWSSNLLVTPPIGRGALIAVLPVENLSGAPAPLEAIRQSMRSRLSDNGFRLLEDEVLAKFMKRYRIRNTSGLNSAVSKAILDETGSDAFLVTSLETYQISSPPFVSLFSRLVLSRERSEIAWMDGVGLSGDGYPGFLGLNAIEDPNLLLETAVRCLADSLERSLSEAGEAAGADSSNAYHGCDERANAVAVSPERRGKRRYRPRIIFRSPTTSADRRYSVALIPFRNLSGRKYAGEIAKLHFLNQLMRSAHFAVVEPGLVREQLLKYRIIMEAGPSFANAEVFSSRRSLGVDLVLSGTVFDYEDAVGIPKVAFSVKIIDGRSSELVWSSRSRNSGDEDVVFFDVGRVYTGHRLASEMAWGTVEALTR
jgi:TolB-like protein